MSGDNNKRMPDGGDDLIAAEYVLGVLDSGDRRRVEARIEDDRAFASLVESWQFKLAPLDEDYVSVPPPPALKVALDARLFPATVVSQPGILQSLGFWRSLSFGALVLAAAAILPDFLRPQQPASQANPIVAAMQAEGGEVRFVALYEPGGDEIRITTVKADKEVGKDFELWLIEADGKPKSLGVIAGGENLSLKVKPELVALISAGDTFAVSVEPLGGSPTGNPTGPVIAAGASRAI